MERDPRPAINMEKQLGWARTLGGAESLGISNVGQSVSQVDGISDMAPACWLCSRGGRVRKGTMASFCLSVWENSVPSSHLDARHFSSSLYATGSFQAATLMLELRGSKSD